MLAVLSKCESLRMRPGFWANVWAAATMVVSNPPTTTARESAASFRVPPFAHREAPRPALSDPLDESQEIRQTKAKNRYLSSQTSSMRQPLNRLLTMIVNPFTQGCQQVESRV